MFFLPYLYVLLQILIVTVPHPLDLMQGHKELEYTAGRITFLLCDCIMYIAASKRIVLFL